MHWTIRGLDPVLALRATLRTLHQSGRDQLLWPDTTDLTHTPLRRGRSWVSVSPTRVNGRSNFYVEEAAVTIMEPAADRKRHGKHYTPVALADFLATRLL